MTFTDDVHRWTQRVETQSRDVFVGTVMAAHASIVEGSPVTGAPGQPVDTGNLRASWQVDIQGDVGTVSTNVEYAPHVEDNIRGVVFRNHGPHSVKLTRAGFGNLVAHVTRQVVGRA